MDIEANAATIHDATQLVISMSDVAATSEGASLAAANSGQLRERRPPQTARKTTLTEIEKQAKGQSRIWDYFARRREQTRKDYCVLLAWQVGSETFVVDVPVADPDNEEAVFADINAQYYAHRGRWRKHFGLCGVEGVERVELRLGGLIAQNVLVAKACPENKPDREDLQASMDKYEAMIDRVDFCCCPPNDEAVEPGWVHASGCPVDYGDPCDGPECPYEILEYFGCRKRNLEGEWDEFRLQCFHRPALAEQQKSLNLEAEDWLILRYDQIRRGRYGQQPRDQKFPGLLIHSRQLGRELDMPLVVLKCITSFMMLVVTVVGRLGCGDWNSGFAAGSWFANWVSAMQASRQPVFSRAGHHDGWYEEALRRDD